MSRRARVVTAVAAILALAVGAATSMRSWLAPDRDVIVATPSLGGLEARETIPLRRGQQACVQPVVLTPESAVARFRVVDPDGKRPVPDLRVTATGPGYRSAATVRDWGVPGDQTPSAPLAKPGGEVRGRVCVRNLGPERMEVVGTNEFRSRVPAVTTRDGAPAPDNVQAELTLLEREPSPFSSRVGDMVDHASLLTGGIAPPWLLWALLVLTVAGLPLLVLAGVLLSGAQEQGVTRTPRR